ncbi:hypothetical protein TNIN_457641 [Trichonephila inaurata madagascariensis]|uniref:Uncharacterized protein n=1 Tax=Trichonephila inaurata madagascariensis TaxID=2747483 RepID=A0A8X6X575_9ARAC|nr:hypothetical protein TNIN_457641 [Trichonephila inaurata madagascariensis]
MPPQSYPVGSFSSRVFWLVPEVLKCSGGHLTPECTKSAKAQAFCRGPPPKNFFDAPKPYQQKNNNKTNRRRMFKSERCPKEKSPKTYFLGSKKDSKQRVTGQKK